MGFHEQEEARRASFTSGLSALLVGAVIGTTGWMVRAEEAGKLDTPQTLRASRLVAAGCGENTFVHVTGCVPLPGGFADDLNFTGSHGGTTLVACVPDGTPAAAATQAPSPDQPYDAYREPCPPLPDLWICLKLSPSLTAAQYRALLDQREFTGVVRNGDRELDRSERELLARAFPGADPDHSFLIDVNAQPGGGNAPHLLVIGGVILALGMWLTWRARPGTVRPEDAKPL